MGVHVAVGVERREDVPVVGLGEFSDLGLIAGEELVEDVRDRGRRDPLASVNSTLDEDSRFILSKAQFDTLDHPTLVGFTGVDDLDVFGVPIGEGLEVGVDFLDTVVAGPPEFSVTRSQRIFLVYELLHVLHEGLVTHVGQVHQSRELVEVVGGDHKVDRLEHTARRLPVLVLF